MSSYEILCPNRHKLRVTEAHVGRMVQCPKCQVQFVVPQLSGVPASAHPLEELSHGAAAAGPDPALAANAPAPGPAAGAVARPPAGDARLLRSLGVWLILAGLLAVVFARGCETVADRNVLRVTAALQGEQVAFEEEWDGKIRKESSDTKKQDIQAEKSKARQKKENEEWAPMKYAVQRAGIRATFIRFFTEIVAVLGTMALVVGATGLGIWGQGPERWIGLVLLVVLALALFVGGITTLNTIIDRVQGMGGGGKVPLPM